MKKINSIIASLAFFFVLSCYKPSVAPNCNWANSTLGGKTYQVSKATIMGIDSTAALKVLYPCLNNTFIANTNGTYIMTVASGCTGTAAAGTWKTYTASGVNYLIADLDTSKVVSFDCNSYTTDETVNPLLPILVTYTKQ